MWESAIQSKVTQHKLDPKLDEERKNKKWLLDFYFVCVCTAADHCIMFISVPVKDNIIA